MKQIKLAHCVYCKWYYIIKQYNIDYMLCLKNELFITEETECFEDDKNDNVL